LLCLLATTELLLKAVAAQLAFCCCFSFENKMLHLIIDKAKIKTFWGTFLRQNRKHKKFDVYSLLATVY